MKIYTKTGDTGTTGLFDGTRVSKNDSRIETYGTVDELAAHLGVARAATGHAELSATLERLQVGLFVLGADLATPPGASTRQAAKIRRIAETDVLELERLIDNADAKLPPLRHFILSGGGPAAAQLHVARTVCRRAERLVVGLGDSALDHDTNTAMARIYLNRLSDLLFVLARLSNRLDGIPDVEWRPNDP